MASYTGLRLLSLRLSRMHSAPAAATARATTLPMPPPAPLMRMTRPCRGLSPDSCSLMGVSALLSVRQRRVLQFGNGRAQLGDAVNVARGRPGAMIVPRRNVAVADADGGHAGGLAGRHVAVGIADIDAASRVA